MQYKWRKFLLKKHNAKQLLNRIIRGYTFRRKYLIIKKKIILIQSIVRMYINFQKFKKYNSIIKLQSVFRMVKIYRIYIEKLKKYRAAKLIQNQYKVYKYRNRIFKNIKELIDINNKCEFFKTELEKYKNNDKNKLDNAIKQKEDEFNKLIIEKELELNEINNIKNKQLQDKTQDLLKKDAIIKNILDKNQQEIIEKDNYIEKLLQENAALKDNQINNTNTNNIDEDFVDVPFNNSLDANVNYEIAEKMEKLYLKLHQAQTELKKMKQHKGLFRPANKQNCFIM